MKLKLFFIICLCYSATVFAQIDLSLYEGRSKMDTIQNTSSLEYILESTDIENFLPPLSVLIDTALFYSPEVRLSDANLRMAEFRESEVRRDYWNILFVGLQGSYGNSLNFPSTNESGIIVQGLGAGSNIRQSQILVGLSFPLELWINRSNRIGQSTAAVSFQKAQRDLNMRTLATQVTELYLKLKLLRGQLDVLGEGAQIGVAIKESMDLSFSKATIDLEETATAMSYWQSSNLQYEDLKMQFAFTYLTLERLVGIPFNRFSQ